MNENRVRAGLPTGGQYAATLRPEASGVRLSAAAPDSTKIDAALDHVERLVARRGPEGEVGDVARQDDVEADLRDLFGHLDDQEFDDRVTRLAGLAERLSVVETAESTDTEAYQEIGYDYRLESVDFPVPRGEWSPGDGSIDCDAYRTGVIEALDGDVYAQVTSLAAADAEAGLRRIEARAQERAASAVPAVPAVAS